MATAKKSSSTTAPKKANKGKSTTGSFSSTKTTRGRDIKATASSALTQQVRRKAKQASPVRLSDPFYKRMNAAAKINSRSVPKHLEHMVNIAESVTNLVTREELLDIQSGLKKIVVEKIEAPKVNKAALFDSLEDMRKSGALSQTVTTSKTKYQASLSQPGYLERINDDGSRDTGVFKGGKFTIAKDLA